MLKKFLLAALLALAPIAASAQGSLQFSGTATPGHCVYSIIQGVVGDCGPANGGALTELGVTKNGGIGIGINSAVTTSSGWNTLTLGVSTSGNAIIGTQNFGTATPGSLEFNINGTIINFGNGSGTGGSGWLSPIIDQQFGSTIGDILCRSASGWTITGGSSGQYLQSNGVTGCPTFTGTAPASGTYRAVASGTTDTATTSDGTVGWNSASTSAKSETIYTCNSSVASRTLAIADEKGTASTYAITITPASGTVQGAASITISQNFGNVILQCDGSSNWVNIGGPSLTLPLSQANGGSGVGVASQAPAGATRNLVVKQATNTTITATYDEAVVKSALAGLAYTGASGSFTFNAATTGANGLDTGSLTTNAFYSLYLIYNPTTQTFATLGTLYATSSATIYAGVNFPSGYTASSLISVFATDGSSHINPYVQYDRHIGTNFVIFSSTTGAISLTSQSLAVNSAGTPAIPSIAKTVDGYLVGPSGGNGPSPSVSSNSAGSIGYQVGTGSAAVGSITPQMSFVRVPIVTSQTIFWAAGSNASSWTLSLSGFDF